MFRCLTNSHRQPGVYTPTDFLTDIASLVFTPQQSFVCLQCGVCITTLILTAVINLVWCLQQLPWTVEAGCGCIGLGVGEISAASWIAFCSLDNNIHDMTFPSGNNANELLALGWRGKLVLFLIQEAIIPETFFVWRLKEASAGNGGGGWGGVTWWRRCDVTEQRATLLIHGRFLSAV